MSEYLQKVIYLTQGDYNTLASGTESSPQSITKNGITLTNLNDNYLYVTDGKISDVDINGIISVSHGGTGVDSLLNGQVLVGNGTDPISSIAKASINTPNTLVERDTNGDFSTRNITMAQGNIGSMTLSGTTITALTIINTSGGNGLLSYKPSGWTGVSSTQWGVGTVDIQGVIRSNNSDLLHSRAGTNSVILDVGNYKTYAYALDGSNTGTTLKISTQASAYTNQIQFMNSTTKKGSIGCDNNGTTGIYAASKVVLRAALDGGTTTGLEVTTAAVYPSTAITLGTTSNKWSTIYGTTFDGAILKLHQGTAANPSLSGNARIEFDYSDGQPVVISYTPNDSYRSPAGLKIMGGTSATPAWLEVEGSVYAAGFNGNLNGNATSATTASNLASITSADAASLSTTWRHLWISYTDNATGRPAYTDNLVYQTSTNTLKTPHLLIEHASGDQAEMHITYGSTIDYWWGVGTANINHGLYDNKASGGAKWILSAGSDNVWTFVGNVTGNVSGSSGSCTGNATTATTATNLSAKPSLATTNTTQITVTAGEKTSDAFTVPYATSANSATSLTNFVISTYTIPATKGVRIKYPSSAPVLISCQHSISGGRLILIGGGYGEGGTLRNDFTEVVSSSTSHFTWSMPQTTGYACTIEIMHHDTSGTATVWVESTAACTFTEITALTTEATNRTLLHSSNYTNYTVTKTGSGASGSWGIDISGTATTATNLSAAPTITQAGSSGTTLSAATFYTLTVGGQTVIFKTPTDTNDQVTQNIKTDDKKYGIILSNYETSSSVTTEAAVNRDSKVYVNPSLNSVNAGQFVLHDKAATPVEKAYMVWNATDQSIDFVFN